MWVDGHGRVGLDGLYACGCRACVCVGVCVSVWGRVREGVKRVGVKHVEGVCVLVWKEYGGCDSKSVQPEQAPHSTLNVQVCVCMCV